MAGFNNVSSLVTAEDEDCKIKYTTWRKTPSQTTQSGYWFDLSMSPGNPAAQYYAATPLTATVLAQSTDGGIPHGGAVSPYYKYLRRLMALTVTATAVPLPMMLCDYLMYYPFVDQGVTDEQFMTNTNSLTRYTTGAGVQMMAVVVAAQVGGQTFFVNYTNSDGVAGRISQTVTCNSAQSVNGTILSSAPARAGCFGPFIPLQQGDTGVQSVQSVTMGGPDVGLMAIVLVKPLADLSLRGINAPVEVDYFTDRPSMPRIYDDAYLNFLCHPAGTLSAAPIHGDASFVWG